MVATATLAERGTIRLLGVKRCHLADDKFTEQVLLISGDAGIFVTTSTTVFRNYIGAVLHILGVNIFKLL